ncbi:hypothetical protein [Metarhizobium album]|nr:hypothetical protein [Rhizobium album]
MLRKLLCWIGWHDFQPTRFLTCNPRDRGRVCRHCYTEDSDV